MGLVFFLELLVACVSQVVGGHFDPWMAAADSVEEFASKSPVQELAKLFNGYLLFAILLFVVLSFLKLLEPSTQASWGRSVAKQR